MNPLKMLKKTGQKIFCEPDYETQWYWVIVSVNSGKAKSSKAATKELYKMFGKKFNRVPMLYNDDYRIMIESNVDLHRVISLDSDIRDRQGFGVLLRGDTKEKVMDAAYKCKVLEIRSVENVTVNFNRLVFNALKKGIIINTISSEGVVCNNEVSMLNGNLIDPEDIEDLDGDDQANLETSICGGTEFKERWFSPTVACTACDANVPEGVSKLIDRVMELEESDTKAICNILKKDFYNPGDDDLEDVREVVLNARVRRTSDLGDLIVQELQYFVPTKPILKPVFV